MTWPGASPVSTRPGAPAAGAEEADRIGRELAAHRFALDEPPLIRARLVRLGPREHHLYVVVHHIVADGWSLSILIEDLLALFRTGTAAPADASRPAYRDYAAWQRRSLEDPDHRRKRAWWREALEGVPTTLNLPADRPRPARPAFRGRILPFEFGERLTASLRDLARRENATLFMVILAGVEGVLHLYTGEERMAIGVPVSRRPHSSLEGVVGLFLNTLALPADLSGSPTFTELLARTRFLLSDTYDRQDVPFDAVVRELGVERGSTRNPLVQVAVTLRNTPPVPDGAPGSGWRASPSTAVTPSWRCLLREARRHRRAARRSRSGRRRYGAGRPDGRRSRAGRRRRRRTSPGQTVVRRSSWRFRWRRRRSRSSLRSVEHVWVVIGHAGCAARRRVETWPACNGPLRPSMSSPVAGCCAQDLVTPARTRVTRSPRGGRDGAQEWLEISPRCAAATPA